MSGKHTVTGGELEQSFILVAACPTLEGLFLEGVLLVQGNCSRSIALAVAANRRSSLSL